MELTLPVYIEVRKQRGLPLHQCRPLFAMAPVVRNAQLGAAMSKLGRELKPILDTFGRDSRHDALVSWAFSPPLETHLLNVLITLKDREVKVKLLFVVFSALERRIAFTPSLPHVWFEIMPDENLADRAASVLSRHFREQEKLERRSGGGNGAKPEQFSLQGQAWVTTMDLQVVTKQVTTKQLERKLSSLFDETKLDGGVELARVGRCLNWLYPNELEQAVEREPEVARLLDLLESPDNRPIALIGPRLAGKTTVLHEVIRRQAVARGKPFGAKQNVWLLSPQRLISGMMYVGQWEGRVQAILQEAKKRRHTLYFDNFLGLYQAGISRDAQLSVADMLKPFILRRETRVLAEMTPEAFQAFQERDRGLADQFDVLRIEALKEGATLRVMLDVQRELEAKHHSLFDIDVLPTVLQLHRSYRRDAAFPGKSAAFSRRLAQKHAKQTISRATALAEFQQQTGLSAALLDDRRKLDRDEIVAELRKKVVSQEEAVQAAADVVGIVKARLAAPDRPPATLLFLGPTGVGKTQCARALAQVMFSDPGRLLRFDMNEYVTPHAVAQLVGTFAEPDGLLTAAVRRQPFAVVLLDEIEKAHPDVFDLLLQVLGEGRLTDALGRTADFSNAVVVMTSNLGTTASNHQLGLAPPQATRRQAFVKAAENFFRPEFFNRIDRIIPFDALSREEMRKIADMVLAEVFHRDGLVRRRSILSVEPRAMERIVDAGYHPHFGARALKRAIERNLVQPIAASLAGVKPELPAVISIYPAPEGVRAVARPLQSVKPGEQAFFAELEPAEQLARADRYLTRAERDLEALRDSTPGGRGLSPQQVFYYSVKEQWRQLRELHKLARQTADAVKSSPMKLGVEPKKGTYSIRRINFNLGAADRRVLREVQAADDIHEYLREQANERAAPGDFVEQLGKLRHEAAALEATLSSVAAPRQVLFTIRPIGLPARDFALRLRQTYRDLFADALSFDVRPVHSDETTGESALEISGPGIHPLAAAEAGVHVWCRFHENLLPVAVAVAPRDERTAKEQYAALAADRRAWLDELAEGRSTPDADPQACGAIIRFYDEAGPTLDLRSGQSLPKSPTPEDLKMMILAGLPLPPEMEV